MMHYNAHEVNTNTKVTTEFEQRYYYYYYYYYYFTIDTETNTNVYYSCVKSKQVKNKNSIATDFDACENSILPIVDKTIAE